MPKSAVQGAGVWAVKTRTISYVYAPTLEELQFHYLFLCQSQIGGRLNICFFGRGIPYVLVLEYKKLIGKTNWMFYSDTAANSNLLWESESNDVILIHSLVENTVKELSGGKYPEAMISTSPGNVSAPERQKGDFVQLDLINNLKTFLDARQPNRKPVARKTRVISDASELIDLNSGKEALLKTVLNELGILSYPAFLCCLIKEYANSTESQLPFSIILFRLVLEKDGKEQSLAKPEMLEILNSIKKLQRNTDFLAQYDNPDTFALVLPETKLEGGKFFADRVRASITKLSKTRNAKAGSIQFFAAISAPEGFCTDVEKILGAGDAALKKAAETGQWLVPFNKLDTGTLIPAKHVDVGLVQDLTEKLLAKPYAIFSFPLLVAFLEYQYYRSKRSGQVSYVLLISLAAPDPVEEDVVALREAMALLSERMTAIQKKHFLLFQYNGNTIAALFSKGLLSVLKDYSQQIAASCADKPLSNDEAISEYDLEYKICKISMEGDAARKMLRVSPVEVR